MFKALLLQRLYGLSDRQIEECLYDRFSCRRFCGFGLDEALPDARTLLRFRQALGGKRQVNKALACQLERVRTKAGGGRGIRTLDTGLTV